VEKRPDKIDYYLSIAATVLDRGTCLRRNYGAVIVKNDEIVGTGYTGAPRGEENCCDRNYCERDKLQVKPGERYELCRSVHAEMNAVLSAGRFNTLGATIYVIGRDMKTGQLISTPPCSLCERIIKNAGISDIIAPCYHHILSK